MACSRLRSRRSIFCASVNDAAGLVDIDDADAADADATALDLAAGAGATSPACLAVRFVAG